jgi:hypothetical protein
MIESQQNYPSFIEFTNSLLLPTETKPTTPTSSQNHHHQSLTFSLSSLEDDLLQSSSRSSSESNSDHPPILLFSKIPQNTPASKILSLALYFGDVRDLTYSPSTNMAHIHYTDLVSAKRCLEASKRSPLSLDSSSILVSGTSKKTLPHNSPTDVHPSKFLVVYCSSDLEIVTTLLVNRMLGTYGAPVKMEIFPGKPTIVYVQMYDMFSAMVAKEQLDDTTQFNAIHVRVDYTPENTFNQVIENHFSNPEFDPIFDTQNSLFSIKSQPYWPKDEVNVNVLSELKFEKFNSFPSNFNSQDSKNTVLVKNLPANTTLRDIFRLFNCFGNVMKIKIFYSNPENALVEFEDDAQAGLAKNLLNGCPFRDSILHVGISKNPIIINIPYIPEGHKYLADYKNSKEHRYRIAGSKNCRNIARPSSVIHLSNLCEDKELDFYYKLFQGFGVVKRMFTLKGKAKSILVEMGSIADAVEILVNFHNFSIEGKFLKVSFSKYQKIKE